MSPHNLPGYDFRIAYPCHENIMLNGRAIHWPARIMRRKTNKMPRLLLLFGEG